MSLNADDVTLNNNIIPPNNNLNVVPDVEVEVQSHRRQNVYPAVSGPRIVQESTNEAEHTSNPPVPTSQLRKTLPSDNDENLSSVVREPESGSPGGVKFNKSPPKSSSETSAKACAKPAASNKAVIKLWVVGVITLIHCVVLMVAEHLTHSLTLRVEAYHSLYNVGVLAGSLLSIKLCQQPESFKNTFGWARIDVVLYLVSLIFLSSLCFSVAVEAAQTALHIHHQDPMHHPKETIFVCCGSLAVNAIVFFLIGGYTQHQGSFCELRGSGEVFINKQVKEDSLQRGQRTLSARNQKATTSRPNRATLRQGYRDVLRDISGILLAMLGAIVVFMHPESLASYYLDSVLAVVSVSVLMWLSYPFGKECSNILLQTIPNHIDVSKFSETLQQSFPDVLNVHHLHIWSLRPGQVVATVHMIFADKGVYQKNSRALTKFFKQQHISSVTLQPEFIVAEMATLPYCRCVDHLLDEAEDICDDFAMTHLDIHYHLHGSHHHHHHHDEYHHDHEHVHHHNPNHEHVYYNENLHHELDLDHSGPQNEQVYEEESKQRHQWDEQQRQVQIHGDDSEDNHLQEENGTACNLSIDKTKYEDQKEARVIPDCVQEAPTDSSSCHTSGDGEHQQHDIIRSSMSRKTKLNVASDGHSNEENDGGPRISDEAESRIESRRENDISKVDDTGGHEDESNLISSKHETRAEESPKFERKGKVGKDSVNSSIKLNSEDIEVRDDPKTKLCEKSSRSLGTRSHQRMPSISVSEDEDETKSNSVYRQKQSPQTSCSELDNDEDLSYTYHKTASEKKKGFEDADCLLSCDQPTTKDIDEVRPESSEKSTNLVHDSKL